MLKLLHAADLHLDSPFAALSPEAARQRREEQRRLLQTLADTCRSENCQLLFLAGDLFDGAHVYKDTVEALIGTLKDCPAKVFIAPGNHDWLSPGSPYRTADWPDNVHIFKQEAIECVELPELNCRVYGAGFCHEHVGSLLEGFAAPTDGFANLMVLHGDPTGGADYNPITKEQIAGSNLTYLALGHIHKGDQLRVGSTLCAWPGCPMGRGFDECGDKGALLVTQESGGFEAQFLPLGARRYEILEVKASDDPLAAILSALPEDTGRDVYRIVLTGESRGVDRAALYAALQNRFDALELVDKTVPPLELWAAAGEDSLKGRFLAGLKARYEQAEGRDKETVLLAARYGLSIFEEREVAPL